MSAIVGPIGLEDAAGVLIATATYAVLSDLREPAVVYRGVRFLQNRQDGGRWIYRATAEPGRPDGASEPLLKDVRVVDPPDPPVATCPTCGREVDA